MNQILEIKIAENVSNCPLSTTVLVLYSILRSAPKFQDKAQRFQKILQKTSYKPKNHSRIICLFKAVNTLRLKKNVISAYICAKKQIMPVIMIIPQLFIYGAHSFFILVSKCYSALGNIYFHKKKYALPLSYHKEDKKICEIQKENIGMLMFIKSLDLT